MIPGLACQRFEKDPAICTPFARRTPQTFVCLCRIQNNTHSTKRAASIASCPGHVRDHHRLFFPKQFTVGVLSSVVLFLSFWCAAGALLLSSFSLFAPSSSSCPLLVLQLSSSCIPLDLLLSSSCPPALLLLTPAWPLRAGLQTLSSCCPLLVLRLFLFLQARRPQPVSM